TPPSRFVRVAIYSQSAVKQEKASLAVPQVFHLMNNFDIPVGSVREVVKTPNGTKVFNEITSWTSVIDLKNRTYSFKTYQGQQVCQIDIQRTLKEAKGKVRRISMDSEFTVKDVSNNFKK
ncbi:MAG: linear amide C-N hydrolase, partial [Bacteroidales bacterium]|nr:linear amide C-N hydrolase [Bacteroidales bacterium]